MTKAEQLAIIGRVREFVSDVRLGKKSTLSVMDILMDLKRLEDAVGQEDA